MKNLIKRIIDMMIQKNWLNAINKELYRCNRHHSEYRKSKEVLYQLIKRYNEIYDTKMEMKSDAAD